MSTTLTPSCVEFIHFFLSTLMMVILCIAALQALLLSGQEWMLKHKQAIGFVRYFPALEVMESYLFTLIYAAIILLTLIVVTSLVFFHSIHSRELQQKAFFSMLAWSILAALLIGRNYFGWRGRVVIRWTLVGVGLIAGIYVSALVSIGAPV